MIRVFIAEDQAMVAGALAALLDIEHDIEVVGTAKDGREALEAVRRLRPDVSPHRYRDAGDDRARARGGRSR